MKNQTSAKNSAKNQNSENLLILNLGSLAKEIESKAKHKVQTEKQYLYKYPESWSKNDIQSKEGKQFRSKARKSLQRFCNNIFVYADFLNKENNQKNKDTLIEEINRFKAFYAEFYLINDYSTSSLTSSEDNKKDVELMLNIIDLVK